MENKDKLYSWRELKKMSKGMSCLFSTNNHMGVLMLILYRKRILTNVDIEALTNKVNPDTSLLGTMDILEEIIQ